MVKMGLVLLSCSVVQGKLIKQEFVVLCGGLTNTNQAKQNHSYALFDELLKETGRDWCIVMSKYHICY